jgi:hypothetical protein
MLVVPKKKLEKFWNRNKSIGEITCASLRQDFGLSRSRDVKTSFEWKMRTVVCNQVDPKEMTVESDRVPLLITSFSLVFYWKRRAANPHFEKQKKQVGK